MVGAGFSVLDKRVFFTVNGALLDKSFEGVDVEGLTPAAGLKSVSTKLRFNFGLQPFAFDVRGYARRLLKQLFRWSDPGK